MKKRLDLWLVERGHAPSRARAQAMIEAGQVHLFQQDRSVPLKKPSFEVTSEMQIQIQTGEADRFVSRAGLKLESALEFLALDVRGFECLDIGQSTGGFTDCLLQRGVKRVVGVDVGHGQLAATLKRDPRVIALEGINARELSKRAPEHEVLKNLSPDLVVMDLSFISQNLVLPEVSALSPVGTKIISLVKPQFEVGPEGLGKGGIVRDPLLSEAVRRKIVEFAETLGWKIEQQFDSALPGKDGNKEFFFYGIKKES